MSERNKSPAIGGLVPFSTVDWPGQLAAVVFIAGCPWRCGYCHNPHLQQRQRHIPWRDVLAFLKTRQGKLDAVVFSGGEPLSEPALPRMVHECRQLGFHIGLHTAGIYPHKLAALLPQLDWVGLDIKHRFADYDRITGVPHSGQAPEAALKLLLANDTPFECRTTWSPELFSTTTLDELTNDLRGRGVKEVRVQKLRPVV